MDIRKLQRVIVDGLEDVKAQDIVVFNTEHLSPLFERVIVATGNSNRQTKALASSVRETVKKAGFQIMRTEGEDNGEWIIVDCAAVVVHIMQPAIRQYYQLEEIWGEKPVALKRQAQKAGLVKASEPMDEVPAKVAKSPKAGKTPTVNKAAATKVAAKKAVGKKVAAKKVAAKKVAAKKVAAKTVVAKKAVAKKATAKKTVLSKVVVNAPEPKKAPARKAVAVKKVAAKKVAAKKVAVKKVVAKKAPAKKAPARKTAR
ncbi:ribosome silencing factor [Aquabacterium sp. A3]|uniref:ribosome silencing factor n=1 Tax=Aquabacterium sp. A3 TaxID=3132829 RepID=UPI00311A163F